MNPSRPELLFVSPYVPALTGTGPAMRAGAHLEALARHFRITAAIVEPQQGQRGPELPAELAHYCTDVIYIARPNNFERKWHAASPTRRLALETCNPRPFYPARVIDSLRQLAMRLPNRHFDTLFCFRIYVAEASRHLHEHGVTWRLSFLDMDDYESKTRFRYAWHLRSLLGKTVSALKMVEAGKIRVYERLLAPKFDVVSVCSEEDRLALGRRFPGMAVVVIPNVVRLPVPRPRQAGSRFRFLFLGTMDYGPNQDAVRYFGGEIMPRLRAMASSPFEVLIAGRKSSEVVGDLGRIEGITVLGEIPDVSECYAGVDALVVPLRTGGGTRIKIIEALAHGVPVVSTSIGAEGLALRDGSEILLGDSPDAFASVCNRLMTNPALGSTLAANGFEQVRRKYTIDALTENYRQLLVAASRE